MRRLLPSHLLILLFSVGSWLQVPSSPSEELKTSKAFQAANSSGPHCLGHLAGSAPPRHLHFTLAGSPGSGAACILLAAQFAKSLSPLCSSAWRRFSICFSHLAHCPGDRSVLALVPLAAVGSCELRTLLSNFAWPEPASAHRAGVLLSSGETVASPSTVSHLSFTPTVRERLLVAESLPHREAFNMLLFDFFFPIAMSALAISSMNRSAALSLIKSRNRLH